MAISRRLLWERLRWFVWDPWPFWVFMASVALTAVICRREDYFRFAGMFMQLAGLIVAVVALDLALRKFGRPGIRDLVSAWFARYPGHQVLGAAHIKLESVIMRGRGHTWWPPKSGESTSEAVARIGRNTETLREGLSNFQNEVDGRVREVDGRLKGLEAKIEAARLEVTATLKTHATDGVPLALLSAAWLALGVVLTSIPQELACWLHRLCA